MQPGSRKDVAGIYSESAEGINHISGKKLRLKIG